MIFLAFTGRPVSGKHGNHLVILLSLCLLLHAYLVDCCRPSVTVLRILLFSIFIFVEYA